MLAKLELVHAQKDTKCSFPLGPYPRYTWIHEDTPEDGLDKACYEIWKRVQQLSAQLDHSPKEVNGSELSQTELDFEEEEDPGDTVRDKAEGKVADSCGKDDVSLLVQLEYLSIMGENASVDLHQTRQEGNGQMVSILEQGVKKRKELQGPGSEAPDKDNFLNSFLKSGDGTELNQSSLTKGEVAEEKKAERDTKDDLQLEPSTGVSVASNKEICQLLAQFSLKHINESEAPDNKVMMQEAQIIKDFLQNSMFSSAGDRKVEVSSPLPLSSQEAPDEQSRRQLPVFAKLCEDPSPSSKLEGRQLLAMGGISDCRKEPPGVPVSLMPASDARLQEIPDSGNDLVRLLCTGQKEAYQHEVEGQDSPKAVSLELKEKSQAGLPTKSEHSYSTTRHSLKGLAPFMRRANQASKEPGKLREIPSRQVGFKLKEDFPGIKCGDGRKETAHKVTAFTLSEEDAKMQVSRRDCQLLEKSDAQDGDSSGSHSSSDSVGSECPTGSGEEDHVGGSGLPKVSGGKDSEGKCGGNPFSSPAEMESSGTEGPSVGYQDKCAAGCTLQQTGGAYDSNSKYGTGVYPARYPGGPVTIPNRPPLINYPPVPAAPPAAPSNPGYTQHQPFYQPRTMRMPHQQPTYQQGGCFVRPNNPYSYSQVAQEYVPRQAYIRAAYAPLVGYWSFVPEYSYPTRNNPKPMSSVGGSNNPPPMAGDGPQCLFQPAYGYLDSNVTPTRFNSGRTGPLYNSSNFQMYYPADGSGYSYW